MENNEQQTDEILKDFLAKSAPFDPDQSLRQVLSKTKRQAATHDVLSFFVGWVWVLFAGFGASMHKAVHTPSSVKRARLHKTVKPQS